MTDQEVNTIRDKVKYTIEQKGLSIKRASTLSGIPNSTLSAWLSGKYTGDNQSVTDKANTWLNQLEEQAGKKSMIPTVPGFIHTESANNFMDALWFAQNMPEISVIAGGAGIGKTMAGREYASTHSNCWMVTMNPALARQRPAMQAICAEMNLNPRGQADALFLRVVNRVKTTNGLLIIDEAQHLATETLDLVRSIFDAADGDIGLALMGNISVYGRLDGGSRAAQFAQLFSRVGAKITRREPKRDDINAIVNAWEIEDKNLHQMLMTIGKKPGGLRGLTKVLQLSHMLLKDDETLGSSHVKAAWDRLSGADAGGRD